MTRAGETPSVAFQRGDELAYGQASQANRAGADPADEFQPQNDAEKFLFSPTDRQHEPITAGAPFGPGPTLSRWALQGDDDLIRNAAQQMAQQTPTSETKKFLQRVEEGL